LPNSTSGHEYLVEITIRQAGIAIASRLDVRTLLIVSLVASLGADAFATAKHTAKLSRKGRGAQLAVRFYPSGDYNEVNLGINLKGRHGRLRLTLERGLKLSGPTEKKYFLPYDKTFKKGAQVYVVSQWPTTYRTHYYGTSYTKLP
jgi:hypothetical protein